MASMTSTRRQADPLRVHQIWDAVGQASATQVMDFEKLCSVIANMHKVARDELNHELNFAMKDGLVVAEAVETQRREETEIYKLPNPKTFEKGDHDWYCFHCHVGGPVVKCEDCPRVFHLDCLPEDRKPDKDLFVCPPCHIMSVKPSAEKVGLKQKPLNQLIEYICERFKSWAHPFMQSTDGKTWATAIHRSEKEAWRYSLLVFMPIDLNVISEKAAAGKYVSLEEFQVDCETLAHGIGVYFGVDQLKGNGVGASFIREAMHDIQEIKLCHECFRRSNEKNHDWWFCLPCTPQHEVVWAKQTGYPYWPAKVMKKEGNKYDVRYFGGNYERGLIDAKNIQSIETPIAALKVRRNAAWNDAYEELSKFQEIGKNPDLVNSLPSRAKGGGGSAKKGTKRASNAADDVSPVKKGRKSESATPVKPPPKKSGGSAKLSKPGRPSTPKTNGTATSPVAQSAKKKVATTSKAASSSVATPARRDSAGRSASVGSGTSAKAKRISAGAAKDHSGGSDLLDGTLDPDIISMLMEIDDESLGGSVYFSDDEENELHDKVSEDAVSSSCNELKSTRNAYIQTRRPGSVEMNPEKLSKYILSLKEKYATEISANKKKQWCYNCEREAIYHCCWNTAYCSIECQQQHWTKEHKRLCRRKKAPS